MQNFLSFLVFFLFYCNAIFAQSLPIAGSCEKSSNDQSIVPPPNVTWMLNDALIKDMGQTYKGKVVGMRPHSGAFKFSIVYNHDLYGLTEIAIFRIVDKIASSQKKLPEDRMGIVFYEKLESGERVIHAISGFVEVKCTIQY